LVILKLKYRSLGINYLVLTQIRLPNNAFPPPGHIQQLTTQTACLDALSHVVEHVFLLEQDNIFCQALLDSWGESSNLCTIYALLTVPIETFTVTYNGTSAVQPLSNAYKNRIAQFQEMYDHCNSQIAWSDHNILDLTASHFDSYCFSIYHNHDWLPPVLPLWHCTYAPTCHQIPLVSPKCSNDGEESGALTSLEHLSQEPH
jgi:hypothetical protein